MQPELSVIKRTDFELTDIISQRPGQPVLHRALLYFASSDRRMSVIVKIYPPRTKHKKNADLRRLLPILSVLCSFRCSICLWSLQALTHACTHWPISNRRAFSIFSYFRLWVNIDYLATYFTLFLLATNLTARAFMEAQLSANVVDGFMTSLSTLAGVAVSSQTFWPISDPDTFT